MDEPATYLIRAEMIASGVVERSDVVGAVFGQTEGMLGDELDLRHAQQAGRVGRIDVEVTSERGTSTADITIATNLDRVRTAVLAAALETIERVGPCRASIEVAAIEDVRSAKREQIVERAAELLRIGFSDVGLAGGELVPAVRERLEPTQIETYAGYPAGPDVADADDLIVVEGRADVQRLLSYDITNVVGVEGTDVPEEIAALTRERTVTAFFDGDRGGSLLLLELAQIGDVDYVTFAPPGRSVEELSITEVRAALAKRVPYEDVPEASSDAAPTGESPDEEAIEEVSTPDASTPPTDPVLDSVRAICGEDSGTFRLVDDGWDVLAEGPIDDLADSLDAIADDVRAVVIDAEADQRLTDMLARLEVPLVIASEVGEFTKQPLSVRVLTADRVLARDPVLEEAPR